MDRLLTSRQSLHEALRTNAVVVVLGPDAVRVQLDPASSATVPLYEAVADELCAAYSITMPEGQAAASSGSWLLHRAVAQILTQSGELSVEKLRRSVSATVNAVSRRVVAAPLLKRLAALRAFDLFVCLTPDDLLVTALGQVLGPDNVHVSAYAPNADSSQRVDVPSPVAGSTRVFFPLGRSAAGSRLAIHEEDALEFLYKFQEDGVRRAPNLLTELRSRDLLLLGCNMPDWLGRDFLRLANESRLSSQDRKMEFFAADPQDSALNTFLSRFDPNASVFPWSPEEFVTELEAVMTTTGSATMPLPPPPRTAAARSGSSAPTIFISYAGEDAEAARSLARSLADVGFGDIWLDKRKLIAGDDWSDRIDEAIEQCDFFMPILSLHADQRREGVFWEEWRKALARAMRVNDAFLLPIGVDPAQPALAGYQRIFSGFTLSFRDLQLLHAPAGALTEDARTQLAARCQRFGGTDGR
jgi:hypothetical protein